MYAMCHTKSNDVLACIKEMKNRNVKCPILQVGQTLYKKADKDRGLALQIAGNKKRRYVINMTTKTLHKEDCDVLKNANKGCLIGAYLVRPKDTGLKTCKLCMS